MPPQQTPVSRPDPIVPSARPVLRPVTIATPPVVARTATVTPPVVPPSEPTPPVVAAKLPVPPVPVDLASSALTEPSPPSTEPITPITALPKIVEPPVKPSITVVEDDAPRLEAQIVKGMPPPIKPADAVVVRPTTDASLLTSSQPADQEPVEALSVLRPMPVPLEPKKAQESKGAFGSLDTPALRTDRTIAFACSVVGLAAFGLGFFAAICTLIGACLGLYGCLRGRQIQTMPAIALGMTAVVLNLGLYVVAIALN